MFDVQTYSPKDVVFSISGYQIVGWDSISIARSAEGFTQVRGIRGKNTRVRNVDTSALISISLIQTSPSNDVLSQIHQLDLMEGTGRIILTIKDNSGNSVFSSSEAYITSFPEATFSGEFEYRNWKIFCQTTESFNVGGNTRPATSLFDNILNEATTLASNIF